jgi:hypothetical protein
VRESRSFPNANGANRCRLHHCLRQCPRCHVRAKGVDGGQPQIPAADAQSSMLLQKRPQRTGQELRALHMQARGLALDKSHDIAGIQTRERDRSVAEPIGEEARMNGT